MADSVSYLSEVLDNNLKHTVEGETSFAGTDYYLVAQDGDEESALSLVSYKDGRAALIASEVLPGDPALRTVPQEVLKALLPEVNFEVPKEGPEAAVAVDGQLTREEISSMMFEIAETKVDSEDLNSRKNSPPETNRGRLACAWAVNKIAKMALGKQVGGGLATAAMYDVLKSKDLLFDEEQLIPGLVVISPTQGRNIGHVGITGRDDKIYSNSSSEGMWKQNRILKTWSDYYHLRKGLPIFFYQLNPNRFPRSRTS